MSVILWSAILFALIVLWLYWGWRRLKSRTHDAAALTSAVSVAQVPALTLECIATFREKLSVQVDINDLEATVAILDSALVRKRYSDVELALEKPGHPGWAVLPLGALLGSLVERHFTGHWIPHKAGGLAMEVPAREGTITLNPFHKILKQRFSGSAGDITAYFAALKEASAVM